MISMATDFPLSVAFCFLDLDSLEIAIAGHSVIRVTATRLNVNGLFAQMAHQVNIQPEPLWHPWIAFHATVRQSLSQSRPRGE